MLYVGEFVSPPREGAALYDKKPSFLEIAPTCTELYEGKVWAKKYKVSYRQCAVDIIILFLMIFFFFVLLA